jgi:hypothetical protein
MFDNNIVPQDMPLDEFIQNMEVCGFDWVKRIGHVHVHVFEHRVTKQPVVITVNRRMVAASYVEQARNLCRELRGGPGPPV